MDPGTGDRTCQEPHQSDQLVGKSNINNNNKSNAITFYTQIIVVVTVVLASIINLSLTPENQTLWIMLLTSCVGYVLPNPRLGPDTSDINMRESLMVTDGSTLVTTSASATTGLARRPIRKP